MCARDIGCHTAHLKVARKGGRLARAGRLVTDGTRREAEPRKTRMLLQETITARSAVVRPVEKKDARIVLHDRKCKTIAKHLSGCNSAYF